MGQGHYTAIVFGVRGEEATEMMQYFEEMEKEGLMRWEDLGIESGYEAEPQWLGVPVAYNDGYLAKKSDCYFFERESLTLDLDSEEMNEHRKNAIDFWNNNVEPFLKSKGIEANPEILIVADWS
jgi:hypothetical protein